jgi:hypothetical protein
MAKVDSTAKSSSMTCTVTMAYGRSMARVMAWPMAVVWPGVIAWPMAAVWPALLAWQRGDSVANSSSMAKG